jgi:phosphoribosyl 1,2-cyclic phosphodiesterase
VPDIATARNLDVGWVRRLRSTLLGRWLYDTAVLTFSLQSGSNGNAIYVEANGTGLLFDAGITGAAAHARMAQRGRDIRDVTALIISHDHIDHVRCAGVYHRKFKIPVYITPWTHAATWCNLGRIDDLRYFNSGDTLQFDGMKVFTVRTPHDAADGVVFVVECEGKRLGIFTDLGHPFPGLLDLIESCDAAYLECNYDPYMLETGAYAEPLKARIRGSGGHLSNDEAAELVRRCGRRPRWIAMAHLSENNNHPELALAAHRAAIGRDYPIFHASRYRCSDWFDV